MKISKFARRAWPAIRAPIMTLPARREQNRRLAIERERLLASGRLIVFIVPVIPFISGGIMSIFNLAGTSRLLADVRRAAVALVTAPAPWLTHAANITFKNDEAVYRFGQLSGLLPELESLTLHLPEYLSGRFLDRLAPRDIRRLKALPDLHINILNQNMELMPPERWRNLYELTGRLTMTVAHHRCAVREVYEKFGLPLHLIPACIDMGACRSIPFRDKENLIAYSNDEKGPREATIRLLKRALPEYRFVMINNMTFGEYLETIGRAKYVISFGEGFDAYLLQPLAIGGLGVAVYNDVFYPNPGFLECENIFATFEELAAKLPNLVRSNERDPSAYERLREIMNRRLAGLYAGDDYAERLKRFYLGEYDFGRTT